MNSALRLRNATKDEKENSQFDSFEMAFESEGGEEHHWPSAPPSVKAFMWMFENDLTGSQKMHTFPASLSLALSLSL